MAAAGSRSNSRSNKDVLGCHITSAADECQTNCFWRRHVLPYSFFWGNRLENLEVQTSTQHMPSKLSLNGIELIWSVWQEGREKKKRGNEIVAGLLFRVSEEAKRIFNLIKSKISFDSQVIRRRSYNPLFDWCNNVRLYAINNYFATAAEKELADETGIDSVAGADDDGKIRDVGHYSLRLPLTHKKKKKKWMIIIIVIIRVFHCDDDQATRDIRRVAKETNSTNNFFRF